MPAVLALDQPFGVILILLDPWLYACDENLSLCYGVVGGSVVYRALRSVVG
jgi:hypothetical protein